MQTDKIRIHSQSRRESELPHIQRKKMTSLRLLNPRALQVGTARNSNQDVFSKLERSLERDNREEQPVAEPTPALLDEERDIEDLTLWLAFQSQTESSVGKVSKERVNCFERQFLKLKKRSLKNQVQLAASIASLEGSIKQKYKQMHVHFEQIKREKAVAAMNKAMARGQQDTKRDLLMISDNSSKIIVLKDTIAGLRREVAEVEKNIGDFSKRLARGKKQWAWLLKKMLRSGCYLRRGVIPILEEMVEIRQTPRIEDMPSGLDQVSKKCLLEEFKTLALIKPKDTTRRISSEAKTKINGLAQSELIRDIYKDTKQFMAELVREASWKQELTLPPIYRSIREKPTSDWRENQRRRLSNVYTGERYVASKSILFGPRVETFA